MNKSVEGRFCTVALIANFIYMAQRIVGLAFILDVPKEKQCQGTHRLDCSSGLPALTMSRALLQTQKLVAQLAKCWRSSYYMPPGSSSNGTQH